MHRFQGFWLFLLISIPLILGYLILSFVTAYNPLLGILLLAGMLVTLWAFYNPAQPLLLAFFLVPFANLTVLFPPKVAGPQGLALLSTITFSKVIFLITLFTWFIRTLVFKDDVLIRRISGNFLPISIFLFVVISAASFMKANDRDLFLFFEMRFISHIVMYFLLVIYLVEDKMFLRRVLQVLLVAYTFVGLMGFYEILTKTHVQELLGYPLREASYALLTESFRVLGPYGDPNFFGINMVFASGIALFFLKTENSRKIRAVLIFVLLLLFIGVLGSASKSSLLAYLGGIWILLFFSELRHKWLIAISIVAAMSMVLFIYTVTISERAFSRYMGGVTVGVIQRVGLSKVAIEMAKDNPVLGVGTGNFLEAHSRYLDPQAPRAPSWPFNAYLQVWAENGSIGLLAYLSMYLFAFLNLYRAAKSSRDPMVRSMAISFLSIFTGLAIFIVGHNAQGIEEIYWWIFAFSLITWRLSNTEEERG